MLQAHMKSAHAYASVSYCVRRQVGCIIVDGDRVVSIGYNGTPPGSENVCEVNGVTKPDVIHAEDNALKKLNYRANGMSLFVTTAPCVCCAKLILESEVSDVYYDDEYKNIKGLEYLNDNGIPTRKIIITTLT